MRCGTSTKWLDKFFPGTHKRWWCATINREEFQSVWTHEHIRSILLRLALSGKLDLSTPERGWDDAPAYLLKELHAQLFPVMMPYADYRAENNLDWYGDTWQESAAQILKAFDEPYGWRNWIVASIRDGLPNWVIAAFWWMRWTWIGVDPPHAGDKGDLDDR